MKWKDHFCHKVASFVLRFDQVFFGRVWQGVGCLNGVSLQGNFASLCVFGKRKACKPPQWTSPSHNPPPLSTANRTTKETCIFVLRDSLTSSSYSLLFCRILFYERTRFFMIKKIINYLSIVFPLCKVFNISQITLIHLEREGTHVINNNTRFNTFKLETKHKHIS